MLNQLFSEYIKNKAKGSNTQDVIVLSELVSKMYAQLEVQKGEKGDQGVQGERGLMGLRGAQGMQGERGIAGMKGDIGVQGQAGPKGEQGARGPKGQNGKDGANGSPDSAHEIKTKLESLSGSERLNAEAIAGLSSMIKKMLTTVRSSGGHNGGGSGVVLRGVADTPSIDLTVNLTTGVVSGVVLPAGVDHNSLANLATGDVHVQYVKLAGRAGGQTIYGGTAAGEGLMLVSTFHATKGTIQIGANTQIYVTPVGMVGLNTTTGLAQHTVKGLSSFAGTGTVSTTAGSPTITGVGTSFTTELGVGDRVVIAGETRYIKSITSNTVATILVNSVGFTNSNSNVAFTILKAAYRFDDSAGVTHFLIDDQGRVIVSKGTQATFPDVDTGSPTFNFVVASNASDQLTLVHTGAGASRLTFSSSIGIASGSSVIQSTRDNNLYNGNTRLDIFAGNQATNPAISIRNGSNSNGTTPLLGIGAVTSLSTLTIQAGANQTGVGTVSNAGGGTTVTGVGTFFTLQCSVGDRVTINGETVTITAIASATSMTVTAITGANSGVAFTVLKSILVLKDSSAALALVVSDQKRVGIGVANPSSELHLNGDFTLSDAKNIIFNTTTGTKIGTGTTQKVGFWNATPIVQPTTSVAAATFVAGAGTAVNDASTFDGYTIKQITKALRNIGLLA